MDLFIFVSITFVLILAALGGHNLRLRRERRDLQLALRRTENETSRREADYEKELSWLRVLSSALPDAVVITDAQKRIVYLNPTAETFFGPPRLGEGAIERLRQHHLEELIDQTLLGEEMPPVTVELPNREVRVRVRPWQNGPRRGVVMHLRDVTEFNRLARARRDMAANLSHELRTPLASIKLITGTLLDGAIEEEVIARKLVGRITTENEALIRLVDDLTALNWIETGRTPLHLEKVNLRDYVEQRSQRLAAILAEKQINHCLNSPDDIVVDIDPQRFGQVLTNLFDNAIKFSPPKSTLTTTIRYENQVTTLAISDEGPGIMPKELPRIFERFYKGDRARTRGSSAGTGLGLAIVKHLVEAHGGTIAAANNELHGATFTITLPD